MNYDAVDDHPSDEELTQFALEADMQGHTAKHVDSCPACSRYVREIRTIREGIAGVPEESMSAVLRNRIASAEKNAQAVGNPLLLFSLVKAIRSPLLLGIGSILGIIGLYIYYIFVLAQ